MALTRVCTGCPPEKAEKPIDEFPLHKMSAGGRRARCRECTNKRQREYREEKHEKFGEPRTTDYCATCGESPDSGSHLPGGHDYVDPRYGPEVPEDPSSPTSTIESVATFGSAIERAAAEALLRHGSVSAAAEELRLTPTQLRAHLQELERRAARRGWSPDLDLTRVVPQGYHVTGASTYYGADGAPKGQWVKSRKDPDDHVSLMLDALSALADDWRGKADPVPSPDLAAISGLDADPSDLLCVYPMGDPHLGMYSWFEETGANFDLDIATANLGAAVDRLVGLAPPAREALIINLGDFFHADNSSNQTSRSHHALDVDTRWAKVLRSGIATMRRCVDRALEKHERVTVICEIGNHDDHSSIALSLALAQLYEREPRVTIDTSPAKFHWYRFGACLIGVTHGDTVKARDLLGVMAHDRAKDWGETTERHWYCGHVHHDSSKEYPGVTVETLRTLAPRDAWHTAAGYRSGQDMKLDVWHRLQGRVNRHVLGIRQVWAASGVGAPTLSQK